MAVSNAREQRAPSADWRRNLQPLNLTRLEDNQGTARERLGHASGSDWDLRRAHARTRTAPSHWRRVSVSSPSPQSPVRQNCEVLAQARA